MVSREIAISEISTHNMNPNVMGKSDLDKLKAHIAKSGNYPPLIVNNRDGKYRLLDGHQRLKVLTELEHEMVRVEVWDVAEDDELILLNTLNNLKGKDVRQKKEILFRELAARFSPDKLEYLTNEKRDFLSEISNSLVEAKRKIISENLSKPKTAEFFPEDREAAEVLEGAPSQEAGNRITLVQKLDPAQYRSVMDYISSRSDIKDREAFIYFLVEEAKLARVPEPVQ